MKKGAGFLLITWLFVSTLAFGMEKIKMDFTMDVSPVGDSHITYKQSATAVQWKILNQTIGQNPALLKREITHELSAYELSNFRFKKDPMSRTFILTFDAAGIAKYRGNGQWEIEVEKDFSVKKLSDRTWYLSNSSTDGNVLYEISSTINLPSTVEKSEIATNELGKQVLRYKLPQKRQLHLLLLLAVVSFVLGAALIVTVLFVNRKGS